MNEHKIQLRCVNETCIRRNYLGNERTKFCPCCWSNLMPLKTARMLERHAGLKHLARKA